MMSTRAARGLFLILWLVVLVGSPIGFSLAQDFDPWLSPHVTGDMAEISGGGVPGGSDVVIEVTTPSGASTTYTVTAAADGSFSFVYQLTEAGVYVATIFDSNGNPRSSAELRAG